ncbi:carbon-nitrogen hydrolase family protein [Brevibacterium sp. FAM 25378]|uniref:carbon-nitrogen hydrolase family protein n=1 Tax=unclassified Brevibacterium TaxID=2614124 RepID=UPI0010925ADC|nr:carbon-nitrogen hydrolase family protein [Brevibacterium sp. S22]TGD33215.1 carbon-nitrogen hydrolase family protein [Brevibacterium sp. S22]
MKFALAQINTTTEVADNLDKVRTYTREAAASGARFVVFPEATMSAFGTGLRTLAEEHTESWRTALSALAVETGITVVVGEFATTAAKVINLLAVYTPTGERSDYAKIHLYDAFGFKESDTVEAGEEPVLFTVDGEDIGLALCYDIRFPKLFAELSRRGARLAVVAASWGAGPGKVAQWELLARARALDSNMFVAALGQADPEVSGIDVPKKGPTGVGHSLVSDPFGTVLTSIDGAERLEIVDLDLAGADKAAEAVPVLANAKLGY